ncbi:MAG: hypothetical protein M1404_02370 [Acidobacteria bacterium]|nr:hypothetical protein [Acidobacteriota bacterium]
MIPRVIRRQSPLPLLLLSASLCFAGQGSRSTAVAAARNQTCQTQAKAHKNGSSVAHLLRHIKSHLGPVTIGSGYGYDSGPSMPPLYYSYYSYAYPFWGSPYWSSVFYPSPPSQASVIHSDDEGEVKLRIHPKTAEVLINNTYAGTVAGLKGNLWLKPGAYDLCVRAPGRVEFRRRIYVLRGKKIEILARLKGKP